MKRWMIALCLFAACTQVRAGDAAWKPEGGREQIALWPAAAPDAKPMPGPEYTRPSKGNVAGKPWLAATNVSVPTMTVYTPKGDNTGAAVVVFPGGGFEVLAMDLEGTEVCDWLTSIGVTCVLLKYRVPSEPFDWHCHCRPDNLVTSTQSLDDAQRAIGLLRHRAKEWHVDPHRIGVIGFSAGGFLVAEASTRFAHRLYAPVDNADKESARPDFAIALYPGHLVTRQGKLNPNVPVGSDTPPTFLLQAQDDQVDGVDQALVYYAALKKAGVPTEMHLYAQGGHAFGLRRTPDAISQWPALVETWMRSIGMTAR